MKKTEQELLRSIGCFLLDMDGTVYLSGKALPGAPEAVARMRRRAKVLFLTNNTSVARVDYCEKLEHMGIPATEGDIYTAGNAAVDWLNAHRPGARVYLLGTERLRREFEAGGILLCQDKPDLCVVGFDTSLTYEKLSTLCGFIRSGVPYLATHPDFNCPVSGGYIPDVGSFLALIKASCGTDPFLICGKPYEPIAQGIAARVGFGGKKIAMVGDRLMTDMQFAYRNRFSSVLVLSGEAKQSDLQSACRKPDVIVGSIAEIFSDD